MSKTKITSSWRSNDGGQMTPALGREMLSVFRSRKISVAAFAREHGIPKNRVTYWIHRTNELSSTAEKPQKPVSQPSFVPVLTDAIPRREATIPQPVQTLEATLSSGSRIVVHGNWNAASMNNWLNAIEARS